MKKLKELKKININRLAVVLAFLAAYCFFQFAYPYHLIRREQNNLFLFDWDYILQTYRGTGWLARFVTDFIEQFFHLPVIGPLTVAFLLVAIGIVAYRTCNRFMSRRLSLVIASVIFLWSFMRETDNLYITRYTVVFLGYISLILLALQFNGAWKKTVSAIILLPIGVWLLGVPVHQYYGRLFGVPQIKYDRMIGLDSEVARENWDKVLKLSRKDLYMVEASYCYNLAHAMKDDLGQTLFNHSQGGETTLLLRVSTEKSPFSNCLAGEAWYQLGCMTVAEQSAIIALQASPEHTGNRYIKRLAQVNIISGQDAAALKYLNMLSKTIFYRKWARSMMPANQDEFTIAKVAQARSRLAVTDFVHHSQETRAILLGLLEADPDNSMARNYLLCTDLLRYDLDQFIEDYTPYMIKGHVYQEAVLIWLSQNDKMTQQNAEKYGIDNAFANRMQHFFVNPGKYRNTYWYYYLKALEESDR